MRTGLMAMLAVLAAALVGCSSGTTAAPPAQRNVDHNDADVKFSLEMIPHHQQTIMIVNMATNKAATQQVTTMAAALLHSEEKDIQQMRGWLKQWNAAPVDAEHGGHDMPGMVTQDDIKALDAASGEDFDEKWLALMVRHLENGVTMAEDVLQTGMHAETKALATEIVESQKKQLASVKTLP